MKPAHQVIEGPWERAVYSAARARDYTLVIVACAAIFAAGVGLGSLLGFSGALMMTTGYEQAAARALSIMETLKDHHFMERH